MKSILISLVLFATMINHCEGAARAIAYVGESNTFITNAVGGYVQFDQSTSSGDVTVTGRIVGLAPGPHGFHVHAFGDSRALATSFASHFNPGSTTHDYAPSFVRHAGDMGNITADATGVAAINEIIGQSKMSLSDATLSILGHGLIIHSGNDHGGLTQPTGGSGLPFAFGKIGIANMASNQAAAATGAQYGISNHIGVGSYAAGGSVWFQYNGTKIVAYLNFTGFLPNGQYYLGFYQFGHLDNSTQNYGTTISGETAYQFNNANPGSCHVMAVTTNLDNLIGKMSVLFSGGTSFANIVSMGVISLGNNGVPFLNPAVAYACDLPVSTGQSSSGGGGGGSSDAGRLTHSVWLTALLALVAVRM